MGPFRLRLPRDRRPEREFADYFEAVAVGCGDGKQAANWATQDILREMKERKLTIGRVSRPRRHAHRFAQTRVVQANHDQERSRSVFWTCLGERWPRPPFPRWWSSRRLIASPRSFGRRASKSFRTRVGAVGGDQRGDRQEREDRRRLQIGEAGRRRRAHRSGHEARQRCRRHRTFANSSSSNSTRVDCRKGCRVSLADREKWDRKYAEAPAARTAVNPWLAACEAEIHELAFARSGSAPRALDVACGLGSNPRGWPNGAGMSRESTFPRPASTARGVWRHWSIALRRPRRRVAGAGALRPDRDLPLPRPRHAATIGLSARLASGGWLVHTTFVRSAFVDRGLGHGMNPRFLLEPANSLACIRNWRSCVRSSPRTPRCRRVSRWPHFGAEDGAVMAADNHGSLKTVVASALLWFGLLVGAVAAGRAVARAAGADAPFVVCQPSPLPRNRPRFVRHRVPDVGDTSSTSAAGQRPAR